MLLFTIQVVHLDMFYEVSELVACYFKTCEMTPLSMALCRLIVEFQGRIGAEMNGCQVRDWILLVGNLRIMNGG